MFYVLKIVLDTSEHKFSDDKAWEIIFLYIKKNSLIF